MLYGTPPVKPMVFWKNNILKVKPIRNDNYYMNVRASKRALRNRAKVYHSDGSVTSSKIFELTETVYEDAQNYYDNIGRLFLEYATASSIDQNG